MYGITKIMRLAAVDRESSPPLSWKYLLVVCLLHTRGHSPSLLSLLPLRWHVHTCTMGLPVGSPSLHIPPSSDRHEEPVF